MTVEQAFGQLKTTLEEEGRNRFQNASDQLHQIVRRIRLAQNESELTALLTNFSEDVRSVCVMFEGEQGRIGQSLAFPIQASPALVSVIETRDTVVTTPSPSELPESVILALEAESRVHLIPVVANGTVHLVVAAADLRNPVVIETICEAAGLKLEAFSNQSRVESNVKATPASEWEKLPSGEQSLHLQAQRFAQVAVAAMRVERSSAVRAGQQRNDLYGSLQEPIDQARAEYRRQFLSGQSRSMVDYLYLELVRSLANGDDHMLGTSFPGRLL